MKRKFPTLLAASAIALFTSLGAGQATQRHLNAQVQAERVVYVSILWQVPAVATSGTLLVWAFASLYFDLKSEAKACKKFDPALLTSTERDKLIIDLAEMGELDGPARH